ncbi:MAG TPA: hypothetical protein VMF51_12475 [Nocardioides sp.]|uniref:hypothetical protein n=1 Tax=Nocardioides sp. TaxID=35761 RepID=UPI002C3B14B9|nr:hypothetical protein [Nocardioides sp.]HTW15941.1 hypothetical protein [Nocardioides sp.]
MTGRPDEPEQQGWPQYQPQQPYQPEAPWQQPSSPPVPPPGYGYGYPRETHGGATTSMVLGIIALACLPLAFMCCGITLPGMLTAPFAWVIGARAKREIDAQPGRYTNRGSAEAGVVMGIIGTVLGVLALAAVVLFFGLLAYSVPDPGLGTNV